jgi:bifunctional enzyme CysN/CysC
VDDGKSTLIGRLLWESRQLFDDQVEALRADSRQHGTQGGALDFALLVDGLAAEREQGITIDVAYRYFATAGRRFILADAPGHEQYTRNMVTGASTADVALLVVDAGAGLRPQTRRHAFLAHLLGVRHIVLAVNKMDLAGFRPEAFARLVADFGEFARPLGFASVTPIPLSALHGDNITRRSERSPWYRGPTLMEYLDTVRTEPRQAGRFAFPVQWVGRAADGVRGLAGTVAEGCVRPGDAVRVSASGRLATVAEIMAPDGPLEAAEAGDAVTLRLDRDVDVARGDVLSRPEAPLEVAELLEATVVWMDGEPCLPAAGYHLKLAGQWSPATVTAIRHLVDTDTLQPRPGERVGLNEVAVCTLALARPLACDRHEDSPPLGRFILVDRFTHATAAAGVVKQVLRRPREVHRQALALGRAQRESLQGHRAKVVWLTGLSGAGKSTLANALELALHRRGLRTYVLDGDNVRHGLNRDLGFTEADRVENVRRIAEVAALMMDAGLVVIAACISPFRHEREMARRLAGADRFVEVHVSTPLPVCEQRDAKGLYRRARAGEIPHMTGIDSPYEVPEHPAFVADAGAASVDDLVAGLLPIVLA